MKAYLILCIRTVYFIVASAAGNPRDSLLLRLRKQRDKERWTDKWLKRRFKVGV